MYDFSNKKTHNGIHYTRYIMSWIREGGSLWFNRYDSDFAKWLKTQDLTDEEIYEICELAQCGKLELEISAKQFIKSLEN